MLKQVLLPVAAFAVTATSVSAFNTDMLQNIDVDLTNDQIAALETAADMRQDGADRSAIKTYLEEEGLDRETLREIKSQVREHRSEVRTAVKAAIEADDYDKFLSVAPDKLLQAIESESDFDLLVEAHDLKESGDKEAAQEIMSDLGLERPDRGERGGERGPRGGQRADS